MGCITIKHEKFDCFYSTLQLINLFKNLRQITILDKTNLILAKKEFCIIQS